MWQRCRTKPPQAGGLYRFPCLSIIRPKYRGIAMRFRTYLMGRSGSSLRSFALAGAVLALSVAVGVSATKHDKSPAKGPLTSQLNRPWPASVQKKQPKFPPALSPAQELKTFHMAPGYQVQLVASEPLVVDPILAEFDGDGRLWVVEMQGYAVGKAMVNMEEPVGDVVADTKEVIKDGFGRLGNIEHSANGLFWGMDNMINVSEHNYNVLPKDGGKLE